MQLFFSGPAVLLILLSVLAALTLLATFFQKTDLAVSLAERAARRLDQGRAIPTLWGVAATALCLVGMAVLFSTKVLALLGVLVLATGLALASLGTATVAVWLGGKIAEAAGSLDTNTLSCLRLGLWTLLSASMLPYVGWLLVLLGLASGVGAVLETLVTRGGELHPE